MDLSNRQRRAMTILLGSDRGVTLGTIAEALDVSPRTVHRELSRLGPALEPWGLTVRGRSGQGVQLVGEPERLTAFRVALGGVPDRTLSAADRRWMSATLLLESPSSVKVFALERELGVGTTAVRAELDALESWLGPFELALVRRRGYGVAVEGPEYQKRLALAAALTERFSENDLMAVFRDAGHHVEQGAAEDFLFERYPRAVVSRIDRLVDLASRKESWDWAPSASLAITLHLVTSLQRVGAGFRLDRVPAPSGDRGPARRLLDSVSEAFGVSFHATEVEWTALQLEASKPNGTSVQASRSPTPDLVKGVKALIGSAVRQTGFPFDKDVVLREGLTAHWGPALARLSHRLPIANALLPEIRARFPEIFTTVEGALAEVYPRLVVPAEEIGYLVLHFAASVERSHRGDVPFRALIVCSSGIGTSHMLASRIRAEVPEIEVVANLSWFEVKDFSRDRYDLLIATVPLPLPEDEYVVVSPLLDEAGLKLLRDHMRRRRLRLTAEPAAAKPAPTLTDLRGWARALEQVVTLIEHLVVFDGAPGVSWWEATARRLVSRSLVAEGSSLAPAGEPTPNGEKPLVLAVAGASEASVSVHPLPQGRRVVLLVHPVSGFAPGELALHLLVDSLSTTEARSAVASGQEPELRAVLARILGRSIGPRNF